MRPMHGCDSVYVRYNSYVPNKRCTRQCGGHGRITVTLWLKSFLPIITKQNVQYGTQVCTDFSKSGDVLIKQSHFSAALI